MPDAPETVPAADLERARALIEGAGRICVLTGAGISTDSGIPDFRGPQGIWTKDPAAERTATLQAYVADPAVRRRAWQRYVGGDRWSEREPNAGHHALVRLEERGKLATLITQNVDGLHAKAGTSPGRLVEIHGTLAEVACLSCASRWPMAHAVARVAAGEDDPHCEVCGGLLKSATISFGQNLVVADLERAEAAAHTCDLMLAVGTSLTVMPIAQVVPVAARQGTPVVILNREATPYDHLAAVVLRTGISEVLPGLVG